MGVVSAQVISIFVKRLQGEVFVMKRCVVGVSLLLAGSVAVGIGALLLSRCAPEAVAQEMKPPGWFVWYGDGQKAAQRTGKPIFVLLR